MHANLTSQLIKASLSDEKKCSLKLLGEKKGLAISLKFCDTCELVY